MKTKTEEKKPLTIDDIKAEIAGEIKIIKAKLDLNAKDWNKVEKEAIAKAYFEITKFSTLGSTGNNTTGAGLTSNGFKGKGRNLDTGCASCVNNAVGIIKNYLAAIGEPVGSPKVKPAAKQKAAAKEPAANTGDEKKEVAKESNDDEDEKNDDDLMFAPADKQWRKNLDGISAAAKEFNFEFPADAVTKKDRIAALEKHLEEINK